MKRIACSIWQNSSIQSIENSSSDWSTIKMFLFIVFIYARKLQPEILTVDCLLFVLLCCEILILACFPMSAAFGISSDRATWTQCWSASKPGQKRDNSVGSTGGASLRISALFLPDLVKQTDLSTVNLKMMCTLLVCPHPKGEGKGEGGVRARSSYDSLRQLIQFHM